MKYVNTAVVFQEVPDEVTLAINISNCPCHCPGCHSKFLWGDVGKELTEIELSHLINSCNEDITCIAFMGGDAEPLAVENLALYIHQQYSKFRIAWYSGRIRIPKTIDKNQFDYIKIGPYLEHLGPLNSKTTNQRLYKRVDNDKFEDITYRFW